MRPLEKRLREAEQIGHPTGSDYNRLLDLASDMEDEIDRLRDKAQFWHSQAQESYE